MTELTIRYLGQSGFQLTKDGSSVIIDPMDKGSGDLDGEVVYCTHGHTDHTGGIPTFMERNPEAVLLTNVEVAHQFKTYADRTVIAEDGGSYEHGDWVFKFIKLRHGVLKEINMGVIVSNTGDSFGHLGDTVTYEGFYHEKFDIIAVPITGFLTTSPEKAIDELKKFHKPLPTVVVMHWVFRNPHGFSKKLTKEMPEARCIVPKKGRLLPL